MCSSDLYCVTAHTPYSARSTVVGSWEESPNTWLTAAKNTFVGWALNVRVRMLLKSAVTFLQRQRPVTNSVYETPYYIVKGHDAWSVQHVVGICCCLISVLLIYFDSVRYFYAAIRVLWIYKCCTDTVTSPEWLLLRRQRPLSSFPKVSVMDKFNCISIRFNPRSYSINLSD